MQNRIRLAGLAVALLGALASTSSAQSFQDLYEKKIAKDVFKNAAWELDYDAALAKAKETKKLVFVYFTRSYTP